jgi:hypothetical protein
MYATGLRFPGRPCGGRFAICQPRASTNCLCPCASQCPLGFAAYQQSDTLSSCTTVDARTREGQGRWPLPGGSEQMLGSSGMPPTCSFGTLVALYSNIYLGSLLLQGSKVMGERATMAAIHRSFTVCISPALGNSSSRQRIRLPTSPFSYALYGLACPQGSQGCNSLKHSWHCTSAQLPTTTLFKEDEEAPP